jgi:hypothetical protein
LEYNPHPDVDPAYDAAAVTVSGATPTEYTVAIPSQGANTFSSLIMYVVDRDVAVTVTDVLVNGEIVVQPPAPTTVYVTFQVDMFAVETNADGVYLAGGAFGQDGVLMTNNGSDVWSATVTLDANTQVLYKFRNQPSYGTWDGFEDPAGLIEGGCNMGQYNDRFVEVAEANIVLPVVAYGSCSMYSHRTPIPYALAAPIPSEHPDTVLSVFSSTYGNLQGTDFYAYWGQATQVTVGDILTLENLNYQGIQLSEPIDVSGYDYLHLDVYTDSAPSLLEVSLVELTGGGWNERSSTIDFVDNGSGGWNSIKIPLSSFVETNWGIPITNQELDFSNIYQLKFVDPNLINSDFSPKTFLIGNIYFGGGAIAANLLAPQATEVRLTGPWWNWDPYGGPVAEDNGDGTWTVILNPEPTDNMQYVWVVDGITEDLVDNVTNGECTTEINAGTINTDYSSWASRYWTLGSGDIYDNYDACGKFLTFIVSAPEASSVRLHSDAFGWDINHPDGVAMNNGNGTWTVNLDTLPPDANYKWVIDGVEEDLLHSYNAGLCEFDDLNYWGEGVNRVWRIGENRVTDVAGQCSPYQKTQLLTLSVPFPAEWVRLTGDRWNWDPFSGPQASNNGDGTWTVALGTSTESLNYLWVVDGVQEYLVDNAANGECWAEIEAGTINTDYFNWASRYWYPYSDGALDRYNGCMETPTNYDPSPTEVDVTFQVDMAGVDTTHGVSVMGGVIFGQAGIAMSDEDGNEIWTVTTSLPVNSTVMYKYRNTTALTWDQMEIVQSECAYGEWGDRQVVIAEDDITLDVVKWGGCKSNVLEFSGFEGTTIDGNLYTSPTGAPSWAGFVNQNTSIYPISFSEGGSISFNAYVPSGENVDVFFRFEKNQYPNDEPSFNSNSVTVYGSIESRYTIDVPAQGGNTFSSLIMNLVTRDVGVVITDVVVNSNETNRDNGQAISLTLKALDATEVRLTGPWWNWDPYGGPVAEDNGDGTWSVSLDNVTANFEYLWIVDGVQENLMDNDPQIWACTPVTDYTTYANRQWAYDSGITSVFDEYDFCRAQSISVSGNPSATPGETTSVSIIYDTSDNDATLTGLGLSVHYDSSVLTYNQHTQIFSTDFIGFGSPITDDEDWDNNTSTDMLVSFSWASLFGGWPGQLPETLVTINFDVAEEVSDETTSISFSSVSNTAGYIFAPINYDMPISTDSWDFDRNGEVDALTDGMLLIRHGFGLRDNLLVQGAMASDSPLNHSEIQQNLDQANSMSDIDGDGHVHPLTDGLLLLRYLFGIQDESLTSKVIAEGATRVTHEEITNYLESRMPKM